MIVWAAAALFGELFADRRRIRQRFGLLAIGRLTHLVRNLMIARGAQLLPPSARRRRVPRNFAPTGFRLRARPRNILRSIAGGRLRRFLNAGDLATRLVRLIQVLSDFDRYVRAFLLRRGQRGVTRLIRVLLVRPPHDAARSLAAPTPALADSS